MCVYPNLKALGLVQTGWLFGLVSTALILQPCDESAQVWVVFFFNIHKYFVSFAGYRERFRHER